MDYQDRRRFEELGRAKDRIGIEFSWRPGLEITSSIKDIFGTADFDWRRRPCSMKGDEGSGGASQRAQRRLYMLFVIRSYCDPTRWINVLTPETRLSTVSPAPP